MNLLAFVSLALASPSQTPQDPVAVAQTAVVGDTVARVAGRWSAELEANPDEAVPLIGLATLARLSYDYPLSDSLYRRALSAGNASPTDSGRAFRGLAHLQLTAGDLAGGDSLANLASQAAVAAADTGLLIKVLFLRASAVRRTGGLEGEARLLDSLASLIPSGETESWAELRCRVGSYLAFKGDPDAYATIRDGVSTAESSGSRFVQALCLKTLGEYGIARGEVDSAVQWLGRAAMAAEAIRDDLAAATILQWRGYTNLVAGYYGQAFADLQSALRHATVSHSVPSEAWSLLNLALIALHLGDIEGGMAALERAETLLMLMGDTWGLAVARRIEGHLAVSGAAWTEADSLYRTVLAWAEASGIAGEQLSLHEELANVAVMRRDWEGARHHIREGRRVSRQFDLAPASIGLDYVAGVLALREGAPDRAAAAFRRYADALGADQHAYRYAARARLAEALALSGNIPAAETEIVNAAADFDRFRSTLPDIELRRFVFQTGVDPYDVDLGVATVIHYLALDGRVETAFAVSEGRRARELADRLLRAREISDTIAEASTPLTVSPFVTALEVQRALPTNNTALVEYVVGRGDEPTTAFIVAPGILEAVELADHASLVEDIARFVVLLESGSPSAALGRRLGLALLDPVIGVLPDSVNRLVVVADGAIHRIPFDALRLEGGEWAVEHFSISSAPSAAVAVHLWQRPAADGVGAVLAYGDPVVGRNPARTRDGGAGVWLSTGSDSLARLAQSGREAKRVARYGEAREVKLTKRATEASLKREPLGGYRVLHFATHAMVDEVAVNKVVLVLTPGDGEDGFVTSAELSDLSLAADLVVLSACRTAGGVVVGGEGMQGLTAPLLAAGARSIVASHWPIGDRATVEVMDRFYSAMADGANVGEAIRVVKLGLIASGVSVNQWASFTVIGDALAAPPLRHPRPPFGWLLAGLALVLFVGYWGSKRMRRGVERT